MKKIVFLLLLLTGSAFAQLPVDKTSTTKHADEFIDAFKSTKTIMSIKNIRVFKDSKGCLWQLHEEVEGVKAVQIFDKVGNPLCPEAAQKK